VDSQTLMFQTALKRAEPLLMQSNKDLEKFRREGAALAQLLRQKAEHLQQIKTTNQARINLSKLTVRAIRLEAEYTNNALSLRANTEESNSLVKYNIFLSVAYLTTAVSKVMDAIANVIGGPAKLVSSAKGAVIDLSENLTKMAITGEGSVSDGIRVGAQIKNLQLLGLQGAKIAEIVNSLQGIFSALLDLWKDVETLCTHENSLEKVKSHLDEWYSKLGEKIRSLTNMVAALKAMKDSIGDLRKLRKEGKLLAVPEKFSTVPDYTAALDSVVDALLSFYQMVRAAKEAFDSLKAARETSALADRQMLGQGTGSTTFTVQAAAGLTEADLIRSLWPLNSAGDARKLAMNAGMFAKSLANDVARLNHLFAALKARIAPVQSAIRAAVSELRRDDGELAQMRAEVAGQQAGIARLEILGMIDSMRQEIAAAITAASLPTWRVRVWA
jgi:hypothetical protein